MFAVHHQPLILSSPSAFFPSPSPAEASCPRSCLPRHCWGLDPSRGPWCSAFEVQHCRESTLPGKTSQLRWMINQCLHQEEISSSHFYRKIFYCPFGKVWTITITIYGAVLCFFRTSRGKLFNKIIKSYYLHNRFSAGFSGVLFPSGRRWHPRSTSSLIKLKLESKWEQLLYVACRQTGRGMSGICATMISGVTLTSDFRRDSNVNLHCPVSQ